MDFQHQFHIKNRPNEPIVRNQTDPDSQRIIDRANGVLQYRFKDQTQTQEPTNIPRRLIFSPTPPERNGNHFRDMKDREKSRSPTPDRVRGYIRPRQYRNTSPHYGPRTREHIPEKGPVKSVDPDKADTSPLTQETALGITLPKER